MRTNTEANMPSSDQGCSQGSESPSSSDVVATSDQNLPQSPNIAPRADTPDTESDTMKITPVKVATVARKRNSKQLPRALFRRKSSDENLDSTTPPKLNAPFKQGPSSAPAGSAAMCSSLPDDLICKLFSFLDAPSLMQVRKCNRHLRNLASRNEAGWEHLCQALWATKIHVPAVPTTGVPPYHYLNAYHGSIREAQERQHLTLEELCYDPEQRKGTIWSFRFKESAGTDWTAADPWHGGQSCRKMVFLKDGSVWLYVPAPSASSDSGGASSTPSGVSSHSTSDTKSSDSESSLPELISPSFGNLVVAPQPPPDANEDDNNPQRQPGRLAAPPTSMSWRLLTRPMDLPTRPVGSYVRFSVGGREVPTYSVRRSPTGNWGFVMESCWGVYASFEMPPKRQQNTSSERRRLRRTETGARWVEVLENGEETLSTPQHGSAIQADTSLMDDASLVITNEIQWREAFLYNVGARVLPEGDDATTEFDRAFRGIPG